MSTGPLFVPTHKGRRERRVSWRASDQSFPAAGVVLEDENEIDLIRENEGWKISQFPSCDLSRRRSSLRIHRDSSSHSSGSHRATKCCGGGRRKHSYNGVIDGPRVKINLNISPIDYFSNYKGKIKPKSTAIISLDETISYTYEDLNYYSDLLALAIKHFLESILASSSASLPLGMLETGYEPCVGIAIGASEKCVLTILALWKLGIAYLPLRTNENPKIRISAVISAVLPLMVIGATSDPILEGAFKLLKRGQCMIIPFEDLWEGVELQKAKYPQPLSKDQRLELLTIETLSAKTIGRQPGERCSAVLHRCNSRGEVTLINIRNITIWNRLHAEWRNFPYSSKNARTALYSSIDSHEFLGQMLAPLLSGVTIVVLDAFDLYGFLEKVQKWRIERLIVYPALLRALIFMMRLIFIKSLQSSQADLIKPKRKSKSEEEKLRIASSSSFGSVKYWFLSGLTLRRELAILFFKNAPKTARLVNLYGSMETLEMISFAVLKSMKDVKNGMYYDTISIGRPVLNTRIYLLDPIGNVSPTDALGEIYVSGLSVTASHVMGGRQHLQSFSDDSDGPVTLVNANVVDDRLAGRSQDSIYKVLLRTTDFGRLQINKVDAKYLWCRGKTHRGCLAFCGNIEGEMVVENYRVNTKEIMTHIRTCPKVKNCHVMVYRPGTLSRAILAFIVPMSNLTKEDVHIHLRQRIPEYMIPTIIFIKALPVKNFNLNNEVMVEYYQNERGCGTKSTSSSHHEMSAVIASEERRARTLFQILSNVTGVCEDWTAEHLNWTLQELQLPHTILPTILGELIRHGYNIELRDFLRVKSIPEILKLMNSFTPWSLDLLAELMSNNNVFELEVITEKHQHEIFDFFVHSSNFGYEHPHSLAYYYGMTKNDVENIIKGVWPISIQDGYSIAVRNKLTKKVIAALLNADGRDKDSCRAYMAALKYHPTKYILEMIDQTDGDLLTKGLIIPINPKNSLQCLFFLVDPSLIDSFEQTVTVIQLLFTELLKVGKEMRFNTIHLTVHDYFYAVPEVIIQHMYLEESFGFELVQTKQVNMFQAKDGKRPYNLVPDNEIATVLLKYLQH